MRRVVASAFTARSMHRLHEHAQGVMDGLLDRMERKGGPLDLDAAVGLAVLIQIGGGHAVRNNSANMVYALLTKPAHLARLRAEPELLPQARGGVAPLHPAPQRGRPLPDRA